MVKRKCVKFKSLISTINYGEKEMCKKNIEKIKLLKTEHAEELMSSLNITDDEIKEVIYQGETTGNKLYREGEERYLSKKIIGERILFVEYSPTEEENTFEAHSAYGTRWMIKAK